MPAIQAEPIEGESGIPGPLPLRFRIFPSRRSSALSSPCLVVTLNNVELVRLLDPELGEGYVSLARILVATGISLFDGLVRFDLRKPDCDVHLGKLAPFDDIWVSLETAQRVAKGLQIQDALSTFLDGATRSAWSLDDGEEGGMLHNWKIPQEYISPSSYSSDAMQSVDFDRIILLRHGGQVRTPVDRQALRIQPGKAEGSSAADRIIAGDRYELLSMAAFWLCLLYEEWLSDSGQDPPEGVSESPPDMLRDLSSSSSSSISVVRTASSAAVNLDLLFAFRLLVSAGVLAGDAQWSPVERRVVLASGAFSVARHDLDIRKPETRLALADLACQRLLQEAFAGTQDGLHVRETPPNWSSDLAKSPPEPETDNNLGGLRTIEGPDDPDPKSTDLQISISDLRSRLDKLEAAWRSERITSRTPTVPDKAELASRTINAPLAALLSMNIASLVAFMLISYIVVARLVDLSTAII